ncbi:MAG: ABC transporter ATP-binding protein [Bacteroidetes bacterium]|nr:ABC transporter ATP-binding protein [Bacteroidota bacterium]MBS1630440.1 ABC transporter ATP-binding protein [Bacteroidota bacterium]
MIRIIKGAFALLSKKERKHLCGLIGFHTVVSMADIAALILLLSLVHYYSTNASQHTGFAGSVFQYLSSIHFLLPLVFVLMIFLLKNWLAFQASRLHYGFIYGTATRISKERMQQYLDGSFNAFTRHKSSVHVSSISYQPVEFCTYLLSGMQQLATDFTLTMVAILAILLYNAQLFALLIFVLVPPVTLFALWSKRQLNAARRQVKERSENAIQHLNEALAGYIESNVYGRKSFFINRFFESQKGLADTLSELQVTQALPHRLMEVFAVVGLLALIVFNHYSGSSNMDLLNIGAFLAAAYKIIPGITRIANTTAQMKMYAYTIEGKPEPSQALLPAQKPEPIQSISFRQVSFSRAHQQVLSHFNMQLECGDFAAISSDSGRGKTTILNLLLGFQKPDSGRIYFNNQLCPEASRKSFWPQIAYVKQQTFLFHASILKNITLADTSPEPDKLRIAIQLAGLEDFIAQFPEGLEKIITDGGKNISGGQGQRIALARAFYKESSLLLLDEPFSELDATTEQHMLKTLRSWADSGKIVVLITHNKTSLTACNKVFTLHA